MDIIKQNVSGLFNHKRKSKLKQLSKHSDTLTIENKNRSVTYKHVGISASSDMLTSTSLGDNILKGSELPEVVELTRDMSDGRRCSKRKRNHKESATSIGSDITDVNVSFAARDNDTVDLEHSSSVSSLFSTAVESHTNKIPKQPLTNTIDGGAKTPEEFPKENIFTNRSGKANNYEPIKLSSLSDISEAPISNSVNGDGMESFASEADTSAEWISSKKSSFELINTSHPGPIAVPQTSKSSRRLSLSAAFELPRFRKRQHEKENIDSDNVSVHSLDVSRVSSKKKCKRSLLRVSASLVNLISSNRSKNDSDGFKVPRSPLSQNTSPYRPPQPSPAKRRSQLTWVDSMAGGTGSSILPVLSHTDIKQQEAIYELYQGEKDMVEDLINVTKMYRDSLVTLGLMQPADVSTLFGNIDCLIPVHEDLLARLQAQRKSDGTTHNVGRQIHEWAGRLSVYVKYCANQINAKSIFDEKKNEPSVDDFLQRCIASPFSRKLDLWTLLDGARGRFVKYPLLVRSIHKYTPCDSGDSIHLEKSIKLIEKIIREADEETGLARCEHAKSSLVYLFDEQKVPEIEESKGLVCSGCMKSSKGSKLHIFLFDKVAVVSRSTTQSGRQMYQIYRQPIPATELVVEDLPDGEVKLGSFRSAFGQGGQTAKNLIRISFQDPDRGQSHTLIISDEHDKRQWMQAFHKVTSKVIVVTGESKAKEKTAQ